MADEKTTAPEPQQALAKRDLPESVVKRGINEGQWNTLCRSLFPGANPSSVLLVWDYCKARGLDPLKKPVHIVPMEVRDAKTNTYEWRDVVMPGIYEYRTTAHRTGEYLGHSEPVYGPEKEQFGVMAPEWCQMTIYRWNAKANQKVPFPVQVFFSEVVATKRDKETKALKANARWNRAPKQMLTKCTEGAGIREAFPEEIGGEPTAEEMDGQRAVSADHEAIDATVVTPADLIERVSEALRDNIERAFELINASAGLRAVKINQFLGADKDPDEGAEALLAWIKSELETKKAGPKKPADENSKARAKATPVAQEPTKAEGPSQVAPAKTTPPAPAPAVTEATEASDGFSF